MSRKFLRFLQVLVPVTCGAVALQAGAVQMYSVTDLGVLPGGSNFSVATGISETGQVVGYGRVDGYDRAFLWDPANGMQELGFLYDESSRAYDLNDSGQVVGVTGRDATRYRGFVWDRQNGMRDLGALIDPNLHWTIPDASAINNSGQIVGWADTGIIRAAYIWDSSGGIRLLDGLPDYLTFSRAYDINDSGQIAGRMDGGLVNQHAFLWDPVSWLQDLGDLPGGGDVSAAIGISEGPLVVGTSVGANGDRAILWVDAAIIELGTLPPGATGSYGLSVNTSGQVVGNLFIASWDHAFRWDRRAGMHDLMDLIDPALGWTITSAAAINDAGQIAASGIHAELGEHALLLSPIKVAEPSTLWLLGLGIVGMALLRRLAKLSERRGLP